MKLLIKRAGEAWEFDDSEKNIIGEYLVNGCPEFLDEYLNVMDLQTNSAEIEFDAQPFTGWEVHFSKRESYDEGRWYEIIESKLGTFINNRAWICPTTKQYFKDFPEDLFFKIVNTKEIL